MLSNEPNNSVKHRASGGHPYDVAQGWNVVVRFFGETTRMTRFIEVNEEKAGLKALAGEQVMLFCLNYIYAGQLTGINETCVELTGAKIVYETGSYTEPGYKRAELLPGGVWYVQRTAIESFGRGK